MEGEGKMDYANGDMYEGNWKNDKRSGNGKMSFNNHKMYSNYDGIWKNDTMVHGEMVFIDGSDYIGQFKNGKMHGKGMHRDADGITWDGGFKNGERDKLERLILADGTVIPRKPKLGAKVENIDKQATRKRARNN